MKFVNISAFVALTFMAFASATPIIEPIGGITSTTMKTRNEALTNKEDSLISTMAKIGAKVLLQVIPTVANTLVSHIAAGNAPG